MTTEQAAPSDNGFDLSDFTSATGKPMPNNMVPGFPVPQVPDRYELVRTDTGASIHVPEENVKYYLEKRMPNGAVWLTREQYDATHTTQHVYNMDVNRAAERYESGMPPAANSEVASSFINSVSPSSSAPAGSPPPIMPPPPVEPAVKIEEVVQRLYGMACEMTALYNEARELIGRKR